jgi:mannose-6-phosphate isomerase
VIYAGLKRGVTRSDFAAVIGTDAVEPLLHWFEPRAGDCIMIPAGIVHAIGAGVLLAEVQQMSDATFRVHDWGRVGPDGRPRALHPAEALESTDFNAGPVDPVVTTPEPFPGGTRERLAECPYFSLERFRLSAPARLGRAERFTILLGLGGDAEVVHESGTTPLPFGQTVLLPASIGPCEVVPRGGEAVVVTCVVP